MACDQLRLRRGDLQGFNSNGNPIGAPSTATVFTGAGFHTLLSIEQPTATIRGFKVSARSNLDPNELVRIDDLAFDEPTTPAPPDFTLTPESISLVVAQGGSVRTPIAIGRSGGSTGKWASP